MAATAEGARLTEAHRIAQARIGAQTVVRIRASWGLLDPNDLTGSTGLWLNAAMPIVQAQHQVSSRLAAGYVRAFREIEHGDTVGFSPVMSAGPDPDAVRTSLTVTGPVTIRSRMTQGLAAAVDIAQATSAAAAMRHALDGGRRTVLDSIDSDPAALGYMRTTRFGACAFCALLASRGPVYKSKRSALITHSGERYHDNCQCGAEPVYRRDTDWPPNSRAYRDLYDRVAKGERDGLNAFRRAYEAKINPL